MKKKVVIAGAGILDVLVQPVKKDIFEKGSVPVENIKISTGGDALNEATVLARLKKAAEFISEEERNERKGDTRRKARETESAGMETDLTADSQVYFLSVLGKDEAGESIRSHCEREGISTEFVTRDDSIDTGVNVVLVQEDGSRSFFTNPKSTLRKLELSHFPEKFPEDAGILSMASIFVSPLLGVEEYAEVFARARAQGMIVCADMTKCKNGETVKDMEAAFSKIDYLFSNEEEAGAVTQKKSLPEMADALFQSGVKNVIIKCGGRGCYVKNASLEAQFPAVPGTNCVDTTGAGDSFAGGFLCALSEGRTLEECIRWGNVCGSLATEAVGACVGIQSREQVLGRMKRYEIRRRISE